MIDVASIGTVVGTLCAVGTFEEFIRRNLKKGHQADIDDAVQKERDRLAEVQKRVDAERIAAEQAHDLANALERINQLEQRDRPSRHRGPDGDVDRET